MQFYDYFRILKEEILLILDGRQLSKLEENKHSIIKVKNWVSWTLVSD
jgi:hypothetical protein